ncbi:MAG: hypothetical protein ABSD67_08630 [Terracidiphilus sp.]
MKKMKRWMRSVAWGIALLFAVSPGWADSDVHTNPLNRDPLVREAFDRFYNLDYAGAVDRFERFHAAHLGDPQGTAMLLDVVLFQELYRLDLLDTTFYANDGFLTGRHAVQEDPKMRERILGLADEAIHEADWRLGKNQNDIDALYARGWARALLQLDPDYVDAKLVVGVYEYVVGALPFPFKILIGFAGMTGSKSRGLEMLRDAGNRGVITSVEARTTLALFLRREARYKEAIEDVQTLKKEYPHDYLFGLEEANLRKDAGEGMAAVAAYRDILAANARPGYYYTARMELTYFGLGEALRGQRHYGEAAQSYEQAATTKNVGPELKIRSLLAAGECRDLNGERETAVHDYQAAIDAGPNTSRADTARRYLRTIYKGT